MAIQRKKNGIAGKILAATLGFVVGSVSSFGGMVGGLGGLVGGIAGGSYLLATKVKIKDGLDAAQNATGTQFDYSQFITEDFADNTVVEAVKEIVEVSAKVKDGSLSLGDFEQFTPLLRNALAQALVKVNAYGVNISTEDLMTTPFSQLAPYILEAIDKMEIGKAVGSYSGGAASLISVLCYGEENYEYIVQSTENGDQKVMLGNNAPTLLGDLMDGTKFNDLLGKITLSALLSGMGGSFSSDTMMRALLYGEENVDYVLDGNGNVQMLARTYVFDNNSFVETQTGATYQSSAQNVWNNSENGYTITTGKDNFEYAVVDSNEMVVEWLDQVSANVYEVYRTPADGSFSVSPIKQLRRGLTIGELMKDGVDIQSILNGIYLGDLMDLNSTSSSILLTLAYGKEGVDYVVDTSGKIQPINTPTKVGELMNASALEEKIYNFTVADLLDITPFDTDPVPDPMMLLFAYGEEGVHYNLVDTNGDNVADDIEWLKDEAGNLYGKRTIKELMENGNSIFNDISIANVLHVSAGSDPLLVNLAYGPSSRYTVVGGKIVMNHVTFTVVNDVAFDDTNMPFNNTDGNYITKISNGLYKVQNWKTLYYISQANDGVYYAYATQEDAEIGAEENRLFYQKQLLSSLRGAESNLFLEELELGAALGIDPTATDADKLMVALAYGNKGEHFEIVNGELVWKTNPETGLPYRARTLKDLRGSQDVIQTIRIADFLDNVTESDTLLYTLAEKGWTVSDLTQENINNLKLGEVLPISNTNSTILSSLRGASIGNLEAEIKGLTVAAVLGDGSHENRFLKHIMDTPISQIEQAMDELTVVQIFEDKVYKEGTSELTGTWKYMLTDADGTKAADEYTFNDFEELLSNIGENIKHASLQQLSDDGVVVFDGVNMNQSTFMGISINQLIIQATGDNTRTESTLGELSLLDLLTIIANNANMPTP